MVYGRFRVGERILASGDGLLLELFPAHCRQPSLQGLDQPENIESSVRATVLSVDNQVNYLGRITGGPIIGAIGSATSLRAALVAAGLIRVPVTVLFAQGVLQARSGKSKRTVLPH